MKEIDKNMMNFLLFSYTFTVTIMEYSKSSGCYYPNLLGNTAVISVPLFAFSLPSYYHTSVPA